MLLGTSLGIEMTLVTISLTIRRVKIFDWLSIWPKKEPLYLSLDPEVKLRSGY